MNLLAQLALPLAEVVRGDLRELVHTLGMQANATMLEQERTELRGPRYAHAKDRKATRGGSAKSRLTMGGRTVEVRRPVVVSVDGREIPLETWERLQTADRLEGRAYEQMVRSWEWRRASTPGPWSRCRGRSHRGSVRRAAAR